MITAHSGSDGYQDNSLEFIEAMLNSHVQALEMDVHVAKDGTLYLAHDALEDSSQAVTLEACYRTLRVSDKLLNVDCKSPDAGPKALSIAKDMGVYDQVVLSGALPLESYSDQDCGHLFYNLENSVSEIDLGGDALNLILADLSQRGVRVVQTYHGLASQDLVDRLLQAGLKLSVWTVNDFDLINRYLDLGCYNVTSRQALAYLHHRDKGPV